MDHSHPDEQIVEKFSQGLVIYIEDIRRLCVSSVRTYSAFRSSSEDSQYHTKSPSTSSTSSDSSLQKGEAQQVGSLYRSSSNKGT